MAGIYIHIPFCTKRCIYCDFFSSTDRKLKDEYLQALCKEAEERKNYLKGEKVKTLYFGGGTPSLLKEADFKKIFGALQSSIPNLDPEEITIEANPDDLKLEYAGMLKNLPFNRISIGIQSFDDTELSFLNRRHNSAEAIEAVENCRKAGFENISIDLIYGIPGQSLEDWEKNVKTALSLGVEHLSAYCLSYEKGTKLFNLRKRKIVRETEEESSLQMFERLVFLLEKAGYIHYEISNFAKPGFFSKHNSSYWESIPYLGLGASAHSFDLESRQWNVRSIPLYIRAIEKGEIPCEKETIDTNTAYNEFVITRMRTNKGINPEEIGERFGTFYAQYFSRQINLSVKNGYVSLSNKNYVFTKKGIFISDDILSDLLYV